MGFAFSNPAPVCLASISVFLAIHLSLLLPLVEKFLFLFEVCQSLLAHICSCFLPLTDFLHIEMDHSEAGGGDAWNSTDSSGPLFSLWMHCTGFLQVDTLRQPALLNSRGQCCYFPCFLFMGCTTISWSLQQRMPVTFTSLTSSSLVVFLGFKCAVQQNVLPPLDLWSYLLATAHSSNPQIAWVLLD